MRTIFGIENVDQNFKNSVAAMGVFDGVHKGHQKIIEVLKEKALRLRTKNLIITFDPYSKKKLSGNKSSFILTSLKHKLKIIENYGVENCLVIRKEEKIFEMSATKFIREILVHRLKLKGIVVGEDFNFGKNRKGNVSLLKKRGEEYNFKVFPVKKLLEGEEIISSSSIREYVEKGELNKANKALGRVFSVYGRLKREDLLYERFKIPSYILTHSQEILPPHGLYGVEVVQFDRKFSGIVLVWKKSLKNNMSFDIKLVLKNSKIILFCKKNISGFFDNPVDVKFKKLLKKEIKDISLMKKNLRKLFY